MLPGPVDALNAGKSHIDDISDEEVAAATIEQVVRPGQLIALEVLRTLAKRGASVLILDPFVDDDRIRNHGFTGVRHRRPRTFLPCGDPHDHTDVDYEAIATKVPAFYDARGVYRRLGLKFDNVVAL